MSRVLVVDDSATIRRLVRAILEEAGHLVETAPDGNVALDHLRHATFDLVLLDFVMPRMDGFQLAHAIRANPRVHAVPIALMSAKAETIGPRFTRQFRGALTLSKPFAPDALCALVERAVAQGSRGSTGPRVLLARPGDDVLPPPPPVRGSPTGATHSAAAENRGASDRGSDRARDSVAGLKRGSAPVVPILPIAPGWVEDHERTVVAAPPFHPLPEPLAVVHPIDDRPSDMAPPTPESSPDPSLGASAATSRSEPVGARAISALTEALAALFERVRLADPTSDSLPDQLARAMDSRAITELIELARAGLAAIDPSKAPTLEGSLAAVPIAELLQMLRLQQQTGVLSVRSGGLEVDLCLTDGALDLAVGRGLSREFLLGRYALAARLLDESRLTQLLAAEGRARLGDALLAAGITDPAGLERLLTRQSSELVYEVCRWREGRFVFVQGLTRAEARDAGLSLPVEPLLLEGFRRVDEWGEIEREVPSLHARFSVESAALAEAAPSQLSADERAVLACIDGERTALEVVERAHRAAFDVCKTLARLRREGLVRRLPG
jgi:CheY-like chemotaxis protein